MNILIPCCPKLIKDGFASKISTYFIKAKDLPCNNVKDFFKTSFQYNAVLPMTAAVQGTDTESFYQKLGLGSLQKRYKL